MTTFEPSLARKGLDLLLFIHPHLDVVNVEWQQPGIWVLIALGQLSADGSDAFALWSFAILKTTGHVYRMRDGAVEDDPFIEPEKEP